MGKGTSAIGAPDGPAERLRERIKELQCLYAVARLAQKQDLDLDPMLEALLRTIPQGWQRPEALLADLVLDGRSYGAAASVGPMQEAPIIVEGEHRGRLAVSYPDPAPAGPVPLFLPEEQELLDKLAIEVATIVERHERRERQRLFQQRMQQSDRLTILGELTAGIAHELNTPLGSVLGYAELLKQSEADPARREDLQRIIDSALIGREVVKRLMYFSCEMPSQFRAEDVNGVVAGVLRLLKRNIEEAGVQLHVRPGQGLPPVRLDRVQFDQVMTNLVLNALAAMRGGGELRIATDAVAEGVRITVSDTGHGIAPEHLRKIFQPFFTTKPTGEGTGLGLSVAHGIIKGHGGSIIVESTPGKGACFIITLPAA